MTRAITKSPNLGALDHRYGLSELWFDDLGSPYYVRDNEITGLARKLLLQPYEPAR